MFFTKTAGRKKVFCSILLITLFSIANLFSQSIRFTPDERITEDAYLSQTMDSEVFARTALIASGSTDDEIEILMAELKNLAAELSENIEKENITDIEKKAEYTLSFLFNKKLSAYTLIQTKINTALNTGVYNCVSSTVLFMYFTKTLDIPVIAVETPLHAFCSILLADKKIDVETTNPFGVNPGVKKQITSETTNGTTRKEYAVVPAKNYNKRQNVDDRRIIAIVYNNLMSQLQKQNKDSETIGLAADAYKLQNKSDIALKTLQQCIYNTAVKFTSAKKDAEGLKLIDEAISYYGDCDEFKTYSNAAITNIVNSFAKKNDYDQALILLEAYKDKLSEKSYRDLLKMITINSLNIVVKEQSFNIAYSQVKASKEILSATDYNKMLVLVYSKEADRIARTGDFLAAAEFVDNALVETKNNSTLAQQQKTYRQNYGISVHNIAVTLINKGKMEEARKIILDGLDKVSESTILKNDLKRLQ